MSCIKTAPQPEVDDYQWNFVYIGHNVDENVGRITACNIGIGEPNDEFAWCYTCLYILQRVLI